MPQFITRAKSPRTTVEPRSPARKTAVIATGLAAWFAWAAYAGATDIFAAGPESVFRPVVLAMVGPVAIFLAAYVASPRFRAFVLSRDLVFLTGLQHWRVIGFSFLALYAAGALPGGFAWPAGLGDVFMGLTTPLILLPLARRPNFARGARFVAWNLLGLLDFAVALTAATLTSGAVAGILAPGGLTSAPMEVWPLFLFPGFIVPLFIMAHLSVLFQVAALRRVGAQGDPQPTAQPSMVSIATRLPCCAVRLCWGS